MNPQDQPTQSDVNETVRRSEQTALATAKRNLSYLFNPKSANQSPARLRTRTFLRVLHYLGVFLFWRLVRWGKYALVGAAVAAVGATALGGVASGAAFVVAPPTIIGSLGMGLVWSVGRYGFRKATERTRWAKKKERETGRPVGGAAPEPHFLEDTFA